MLPLCLLNHCIFFLLTIDNINTRLNKDILCKKRNNFEYDLFIRRAFTGLSILFNEERSFLTGNDTKTTTRGGWQVTRYRTKYKKKFNLCISYGNYIERQSLTYLPTTSRRECGGYSTASHYERPKESLSMERIHTASNSLYVAVSERKWVRHDEPGLEVLQFFWVA